MRYNNYHKHTHVSNYFTPDSCVKQEDYIKRAIELGHDTYFTTEHGSGGDVFEALTLCNKYGIHCKFGMEGYIVKDPHEKDRSNYHIVIIPTTNRARKKVNLISSRANIEGFYYKPRIFIEDLLALDKNDVYITTACVGGILRDRDSVTNIFMPLFKHFGDHILLEVQPHNDDAQKQINKMCLALKKKFGLRLIAANDSHYIYPEQAKDRLDFLKGKGIQWSNENTYILDYPDADTMILRFLEQNVLPYEEIIPAIKTTLIFDDCEDLYIGKEIKMPSIYSHLNADEKIVEIKRHIEKRFKDIIKEDHIPKEMLPIYKAGIEEEVDIIAATKAVNTADYFLFNEKLVDLAVNKYDGILTRTGRGSCGAFYVNRILGMTQLDRFTSPVRLYPERFMSTARILGNRSLPDIDFNVVSQEPFVKAARELLGRHGCYPMIAPGTLQESEAFRNVCRTAELPVSEYNEVSKDIDSYRKNTKWKQYIDEAQKYINTIVSGSVHPCAHLLSDKDIREEYGVMRVGDNICCMITSSEADEYKMLKDDFLIVSVWKLISETFDLIGKPIMTIKELTASLDDKVWDIYKKGLTCTINQVDGDWACSLAEEYGIKSVGEAAMFVACIRPSFNSWRDKFIKRESYTTGSKDLDKVLESTGGYILFQENLMQYFEWLGVTPAESIGLIKKISKKKIHQEDFDVLEDRIRKQWIVNTGSDAMFDDTWKMIQSCMSYGFCIDGDTKLYRDANGRSKFTVEEMYKIKNDREYAKETGHLELHSKYKCKGYGMALSLYEDECLRQNYIEDIFYMGIQDVYTVTTESGAKINCTMNHKFPTPDGVFPLSELAIGSELYVKDGYQKRENSHRLSRELIPNIPQKGQQGFQKRPDGDSVIYKQSRAQHVDNRDCCEVCGCAYDESKVFELHHKDLDPTNNNPDNYLWVCSSCHKKEHYKSGRNKRYERGLTTKLEKIVSIEFVGAKRTYSVSMSGDHHTYTVDSGIVTHNCSAHGLATGYDGLYGAYLKSHYPIEYFTVALNNYSDDKVRTAKLSAELKEFGLRIEPVKFGKSGGDYTMDKENNVIYKGVGSIKYCNKDVANEMLIKFADKKYSSFIEVLDDITSQTSINSKQLRILTGLDFFSDFGRNAYLIKIIDLYLGVKDKQKTVLPSIRDCTILSKKKLDQYERFGLDEFTIKKYSGKETATQYREIDNVGLLCELMSKLPNKAMSVQQQIAFEQEYLQYVDYKNDRIEDDLYVVLNFHTFQNGSKPYFTARKLKDGEEIETKSYSSKVFKSQPFGEFAILKIPYFTYVNRKKRTEDGTYVDTDEKVATVEEYEVLKDFAHE